ncbi:peptide MFS transporter [Leptolyngbya sp. 7M]|uniref:peptide MFS transporter n=1 Tax=Leptolyngbya sp. 7M TaxID=2812896 RepID=UPI001CEDD13E|nr:peptide MFS transporter [Leptolyngbya sp. 7M]
MFFTEMWERFSFYGLRPLLTLFMVAAVTQGGWGWDRSEVGAIVGIYASCVYLASLPGGWIADKLLGLRRAVLYGGALISLGHLTIGISGLVEHKLPFFLGLIFIVLGTGLLKPNISAMVGDLYPEGGARQDAGFSIFYMGINIGALIGQFITGFLGEKIGWHWGFSAAGIAMFLGLIQFWLMSPKTLANIGSEPSRHPDPAIQAKQQAQVKLFTGIGLALLALVVILVATGVLTINAPIVGTYLAYALIAIAFAYFAYLFIFGGLSTDEKKRVVVIAVLFIFAAIFWSAFEQTPTALNLFAYDFTDRMVGGFEIPATWFQIINSAFIILLAPVIAGFWTFLGRRNVNLSSPVKFAIGLGFAALSFLIMIFAANVVIGGGGIRVSPMWLITFYFFITLGELFISPVGLSSMTTLSPKRFVGQIMGIWFIASALGNLIGGLVAGNVDPEKLELMPKLFTTTTLFLGGAAVLLVILAVPIARMMKERKGADQPIDPTQEVPDLPKE